MKNKKYQITVNKNQLYTLSTALEVLSRLHSGQWGIVFDEVFRLNGHKYKNYYKKMDAKIEPQTLIKFIDHYNVPYRGTFYTLLSVLKNILLGLTLNESFGIQDKKVENEMNTAFDIKQVLRNKLGDKRQPCQFDMENDLPLIEEIEGE